MNKKCNTDPFPIHGRIGRLAQNGSLGRASAYLDEGGEPKINPNYMYL